MNIRLNALVVIKKGDNLLVQKGIDEKTNTIFYRIPGGGIEFSELSSETIKREIKEELNATLSNSKLIRVIENIFEFNGQKYHEITFLYSGELLETNLYNEKNIKIFDKIDAYAEWISINDIKNWNVVLYPKEAINYL